MSLALKMREELDDWLNSAIASSNMVDAYLILGDVPLAVRHAEAGLEYAKRSGVQQQIQSKAISLARAAHYAGDFAGSASLFESAEKLFFSWFYPGVAPVAFLCSIEGLLYCDLLLDQGRYLEAELRAVQSLEVAKVSELVLDIALSHLSVAVAHIARLSAGGEGDAEGAMHHIRGCMKILSRTNRLAYLPLGFLARAALYTHTCAFPDARRDLDEALTLATRCGFRLHEADAHLGHARLALAEGNPTAAREHFARATKIVNETGYHRRDGELAALERALT